MTEETSFNKEVGDIMIDLSLFINKIRPNRLVAIAAIDIFKNEIIYQYYSGKKIDDVFVQISNREVRDLYDQFVIFFKELDIYSHPEAAIVVLEFTKYQYMKELDELKKKIIK